MAAPQTGLTSCQIGDIGYPRTVRGNPRHVPNPLTIFTREHRFHVVVQRVGDGDRGQYAYNGSQCEHQPNHDTGKIDSRYGI